MNLPGNSLQTWRLSSWDRRTRLSTCNIQKNYQPSYPYFPYFCRPGDRSIPDVQHTQLSHELSAVECLFPHHLPNNRGNLSV